MVAEQRRQEHVAQRVLGVVVAHRDLLEDDVAFELDVVGGAATVEHHVGDQVDGQLQVAVEHVRVVAGVLLGGERVQLTADRVHRLRDVHAVRVGVDLNSRCSRKCAAPATVAPSSRDPTPTQTPTEAERTAGRYSVTTRSPPGSVVRRNAAGVRMSLRRCAAPPQRGISCWPSRHRLARSPADRRGRRGRPVVGPVVFVHQDQRDLAALVDVGDLDAQLVADVHHVLDLGDALAPAELGDVHQTVAARAAATRTHRNRLS